METMIMLETPTGMRFAMKHWSSYLESAAISRWARFRATMPEMKVGTRLAVGLLAALTPVVSVYTYNRIRTSTKIFEHDLKRETRATELALNAAIQLDIQRSEWSDINSVLRTIS